MMDIHNSEIAVLMAAGLGTRMGPLAEKTPKPLIKVFGKPMIESIIDGLVSRGVKQIYVVVGHLKDRFEYLKDKYDGLTLIENEEYGVKNNISSVFAASGVMENNDCFICESDLYVPDASVFDCEIGSSCYFGKFVKGHSDDWVFDTDEDGKITRIGKGGDDRYNMVGIAYFKSPEVDIITKAVKEAYKEQGHETLFWDEIADRCLDRLKLKIHPVSSGSIIELDSEQELASLDPGYLKYNQ